MKVYLEDVQSFNSKTFESLTQMSEWGKVKFEDMSKAACIFRLPLNEAIGYAIYEGNFVDKFFIAKEYRRKGYGRMAFYELEALLKSKGEEEITLLAVTTPHKRFWEKFGFNRAPAAYGRNKMLKKF